MRLINTYDQLCAAGGDVCAIVTSYTPGRSHSACGWAVYRVVNGKPVATNPKAAWYDHGLKAFNWLSYKNDKEAAMAAARAFVKSINGYEGKWTRNRQFDYVPDDINKRFPIPKREKPGSALTVTRC